ncbi:iron-siderophore ABC transporter substrate-binding protein [Rhizobium sp. 2MFCol3.1]|uniref:ABC transporter substrate-binding protein n=1 Tax=Rhizobium sp. 2MFCol3.1 TaxID=1246459 RepID=UPI001FDAA4EB|nr:iron-siderophore ABC transporter substrate-binding protein [Rhizobium sp. 2MFCol3.1]
MAPSLALSAQSERVVTLEWNATEICLSLGVHPVGVAEIAGYRQWVDVEADALAGSTEIGRRQQPSLEAIRKLAPTLVLSSKFRHQSLEARLRTFAPTVLLDDQPDDNDLLAAVYGNVRDAADALDRRPAAQALLADFDEQIDRLKTQIAGGASGRKILVAQPLPGVPRLRIFAPNAPVARLLDRIGLTAALDIPPEPFGFTTIDLEGLATIGDDACLVLLADGVPTDFSSAALWPMLPVVINDGVKLAGSRNWPFGSTASLAKILQDIASALL